MPDLQRKPFQFSLYNLMLAMLPLAVGCALIGYENRHGGNLLTAAVVVCGLRAGGGTRAGGGRGMIKSVGVGTGATLAVALIFLLIILLIGAVGFLFFAWRHF